MTLNDRVKSWEIPETGICPVAETLRMLGGKYKPKILHCLLMQETHFLELSRKIEGISRKVLSQQLRELLVAELINRIEIDDARQRVEYSLTEKGHSLVLILSQIDDWAKTHVSFTNTTSDV